MKFSIPLAVALTVLAAPAFALGGDDDTPPTPTDTTETCTDGQVWDEETSACVDAEDARLDDDTLYRAAREFAYAGQLDHAQGALAAMSDQSESRVLTYWAFTHRQLGAGDLAIEIYGQALAADPDNLLARAYFGMALIELGDIEAARLQLAEIWDRGGEGSWPEFALHQALTTGEFVNY